MKFKLAKATACLLLAWAQHLPAQDQYWRSDGARSDLRFTARYEGEKLDGRFGRFEVQAVSGSDRDLPQSLRVEVDMKTADMNDSDVNEELARPDWFDQAKFPLAVYRCDEIVPVGDGELVCRGTLEIKGIEHPLELPLSWENGSGEARLAGSVELSRRAWQVGIGEWLTDDTIADDVTVDFEVVLLPGEGPR
jgi:polyisoprenoid-binding protein YceI